MEPLTSLRLSVTFLLCDMSILQCNFTPLLICQVLVDLWFIHLHSKHLFKSQLIDFFRSPTFSLLPINVTLLFHSQGQLYQLNKSESLRTRSTLLLNPVHRFLQKSGNATPSSLAALNAPPEPVQCLYYLPLIHHSEQEATQHLRLLAHV